MCSAKKLQCVGTFLYFVKVTFLHWLLEYHDMKGFGPWEWPHLHISECSHGLIGIIHSDPACNRFENSPGSPAFALPMMLLKDSEKKTRIVWYKSQWQYQCGYFGGLARFKRFAVILIWFDRKFLATLIVKVSWQDFANLIGSFPVIECWRLFWSP